MQLASRLLGFTAFWRGPTGTGFSSREGGFEFVFGRVRAERRNFSPRGTRASSAIHHHPPNLAARAVGDAWNANWIFYIADAAPPARNAFTWYKGGPAAG